VNVMTDNVASGQMQTNLENLQYMMKKLRLDIVTYNQVQQQFKDQDDEDYAQFVKKMTETLFDNKRAVELESLYFEHRYLQDLNFEMEQNSKARMQSASNDSHEMRFRKR